MKLIETPIAGAYVVELEPVHDERGFFARTYCDEELAALLPHIAQSNMSYSARRGTLRGLHYQRPPHAEAKLVRCTRGSMFDVIVDLRSGQWFGVELSRDNHRMLYVPQGLPHGFQTLEDDTEVMYLISQRYHREAEEGIRWNDPAFGIRWPIDVTLVSERDRSWPDYRA